MVEPFWKRKDLYRGETGTCVYSEMCEVKCENCDPDDCEMFEAFLNSEEQADDIYFELDY